MKMPPEVLRLSGDSSATLAATFQRLWLATMILKNGQRLSTMTGENPRKNSPKKIFQNSGEKSAVFRAGNSRSGQTVPPWDLPDGADRAKIQDVVQLAAPGKRPVQALYSPCNSGIMRCLCRDGTSKPTQAYNIGRRQIIPLKNKLLRNPL